VSTKNEVNDIKGILKSAAEYKMACRIVLTAKTVDQNDAARQIELAAYMTHCVLEPAHLMLAVNLAMGMAFKHKNFITAANFAKRLLEMPDINAAKNAQLLQRVSAISLSLQPLQMHGFHAYSIAGQGCLAKERG
jgi:coatomer protein complex subunit alpha (xenin)